MEVEKRDGSLVSFDPAKIENALLRAFVSTNEIPERFRHDEVNILQLCIRNELKGDRVSVEELQDMVEALLMHRGYYKTAKAYILYRNHHQEIRKLENGEIDCVKLMTGYIDASDWRVKENSTVTHNLGGLILSNSGAVTANYWLEHVYDAEISEAHRSAALHIHDLSMLAGYCAGWSLKQLIQEGLGGVPGRITSSPARHLSTLCNQMVNFLGIMQNEWAGAQALSSFDTYLAPFVLVDKLTYKQTKQCIQSFIYGVNTPSRWGTQSPFTNVTLDWTVPDDLAPLNCLVGGRELDFCYRDCQKEMDMINKAFIEIMLEGDADGRGFQYPIPTYSITKDFDWSDRENNRLLFEMTAKYGTPYFSNYLNSDMKPSDVRSMCPLLGDTVILTRRNGQIYRECIEDIREDVEVWTGTSWVVGRPIKVDPDTVRTIHLSNGTKVSMGNRHLQPVLGRGTIKCSELNVGDWLPFNKNPIEANGASDYDLGELVGAFLGDGSYNRSTIQLSLNSTTKLDLMGRLEITLDKLGITHYRKQLHSTCVALRAGVPSEEIMRDYVIGQNALTKGLSDKVFNESLEFKQGLISGYMATDGSTYRSRLSTSSIQLVTDIQNLVSSMGEKVLSTYADERLDIRYGTNPNYRIDLPKRPSYGDYFKSDRYFNYYRIVDIETELESSDLYCFEVEDDSHLFTLANGLITHNCRLRLDLRELRKKSGGYFGSGESTGSVGVVTLNLPRIGYQSTSEKDFFERLDALMDLAARSLDTKRRVITGLLKEGMYPYTQHYLGDFHNHFSTIGLVGMNECIRNIAWANLGDIAQEGGRKFAEDVLDHMRERLSDYQEKYGDLFNLEATPAESTAYRLAKHDREKFPAILAAGTEEAPYYTNSTQLPVNFTTDIFEALDHQDSLQTRYTSGTVFHAFLGERLPDWRAAANLVRKIAEGYKLPYYTISPTYSVCSDHGYIPGEVAVCPKCGKPTETYSRITGYYRPISNWNKGKEQEFKERATYDVDSIPVASRTPAKAKEEAGDKTERSSEGLDTITLFASTTCPNCRIVETMLSQAGVTYDKIYADQQVNLARQFKVLSAPTLLVPNDTGYDRLIGVGKIKEYLESI